ncbi:MFS transporter [Parvularcula sp. LCG005]|uniref:MFS transporter n=1 Tax=Parvularcula sp. LCG005 TaxID=3078805 RepID=UPI002941FEBB|nr:MFS transporter [Parvularcula sp. LCG005]WOI52271.1 MFS transporter [Parvularcula sp. LCG005]
MTTRTDRASLDWGGLIASIAAISVAAAAFGHSLPLFSILLKTYGAADWEIGLNTGANAVGAVIVTPFFPKLIYRFGLRNFLYGCIGLMVATYFAIYLTGGAYNWWYPLRFVFGLAGAGLFVASEMWINTLAPDHLRGRILGIYGTSLAAGFALGPWLIDLFGYSGIAPFLAGMAVFSLAALPLIFVPAPKADPPDEAQGFFRLIRRAPATFSAAAMFAGLEAAVLIFLPVLAIDKAWSPEVGARAISVYGMGILALQYAIGHLTDTVGQRPMMMVCAVGATLGALAFVLIDERVMTLYAVLFIWGGLIGGLYTVGLTIVGQAYDESRRAAANTAYVFMYGVGAIVGPVSAGIVRDLAGPDGLNTLLLIALVSYVVLLVCRRRAAIP